MPPSSMLPHGVLPRLRAWFGLSQAALGYCLGLGREMVSQLERGVRQVPLGAALPQLALTQALAATQADTLPPPAPPDTAVLLRRQRECRHRAAQLAHTLAGLPARCQWAERRLAALPTLRAVLAAAAQPEAPAWLLRFEQEARAELHRYGPTAQALLQARRAALLAEAEALES